MNQNGQFRVPLLGQQEQQVKQQLLQQIASLSLTIYARLACDNLVTLEHSHLDVERLKTLAKNSRIAAQAYFEGLGIIESQ